MKIRGLVLSLCGLLFVSAVAALVFAALLDGAERAEALESSDAKITAQTLTGFPAPVAPLPYPRIIAGMPLAFNADSTLHNNGPYGPVNVARSMTAFIASASLIGGLSTGDCTVVPVTSGGTHNLVISAPSTVTENVSVTCGAGRMGNDNDGDTLIDEDNIDGVDNDGDTMIDEDSAYLTPTVCVNNDLTIQDVGVSDPTQQASAITMGLVDASALTCTTLALVRPFAPSFTVTQDEGQTPGLADAFPPLDDDCLLTQPCEQLINYQIAPPGMVGSKAETGSECQGATSASTTTVTPSPTTAATAARWPTRSSSRPETARRRARTTSRTVG